MVGNDGLRTQSSNLWVFSPFIRSIVGSMRTVEENVVIVPDFSCQEIKTGLDIIESEFKEVVTFNSRTEDLLHTLGIHLKTTEDVRLEPTLSQTRLRKSFVKIKRLKINTTLVQELQNDETEDVDNQKTFSDENVTVEEIIPSEDIKVEEVDQDTELEKVHNVEDDEDTKHKDTSESKEMKKENLDAKVDKSNSCSMQKTAEETHNRQDRKKYKKLMIFY